MNRRGHHIAWGRAAVFALLLALSVGVFAERVPAVPVGHDGAGRLLWTYDTGG